MYPFDRRILYVMLCWDKTLLKVFQFLSASLSICMFSACLFEGLPGVVSDRFYLNKFRLVNEKFSIFGREKKTTNLPLRFWKLATGLEFCPVRLYQHQSSGHSRPVYPLHLLDSTMQEESQVHVTEEEWIEMPPEIGAIPHLS